MGRERRFGREGVWLPWATFSEGVWSSGGVGGSGRGCLGREGKLRTGDESSRTKTYFRLQRKVKPCRGSLTRAGELPMGMNPQGLLDGIGRGPGPRPWEGEGREALPPPLLGHQSQEILRGGVADASPPRS